VAASTGYALANPNPNAVGPPNFADYTATVILLAGSVVLWLVQRYMPVATLRRTCGAAGERLEPNDSGTGAPVQNS
jgi:hypothetical protein